MADQSTESATKAPSFDGDSTADVDPNGRAVYLRPPSIYYELKRENDTLRDEKVSTLNKMDGSKNIFCVPMSAPASYDGQRVTIVGTYSPAGQSPYTAESTVTIHVSH